jgi:hypothetical protein
MKPVSVHIYLIDVKNKFGCLEYILVDLPSFNSIIILQYPLNHFQYPFYLLLINSTASD